MSWCLSEKLARKLDKMKLLFLGYALLVTAGVLIQPSKGIFISLKYQEVRESQPASAYCNTSGFPNATVTWYKAPNLNAVARNASLTFSSISRINHGLYICNASNGSVSLNGSTFFNVTYPSENMHFTGGGNVSEYSRVELFCNATGNPIPDIRIEKDGSPVVITPSTQILDFQRINRTDSGRYKCTASNGVGGSIKRTITLDVQYPPKIFPMLNKVIDSWLHDVVKLVCNASSNPTSQLTWHLPNAKPIPSSNVTFTVTKKTQFGFYICVAQNSQGNDSFSVLLNRTRFPPDPPVITNNKTNITSRNFTLQWTKPDEHNSNITHYRVTKITFFNNTSIDKWEYFNHDALLPLNMSFFLEWGTRYQYAVSAANRQGNSGPGPPINIQVIPEPRDTMPAKEPTNLAIMYGGVGGGVALIIMIAVVVCYKRRSRRPPPPCPKPHVQEAEETHLKGVSMKELTSRLTRKSSRDRYSTRQLPFNDSLETQDELDETTVSYVNASAVAEHAHSAIYDNLTVVDKSVQGWEIPRERVQLEKIIGKGAFCQVAKAFVEGIGTVAVKMIRDKTGKESNRKDLLAEYELLQHLGRHPNVVLVLGGVTVSDPIMVLFEYVPYGDLLGYLRKSRGLNDTYYDDPDERPSSSLTSQQLMRFSREIAEGMAFLSENKIVHRDLAARNVLVCQGEMCKITDFGMARDVANDDIYQKRSRGRLPVKWTAYEALLYGFYTTQSDVWSYGIVLYEIFTIGGCPYPDQDGRRLAQLIQSGYRMPKPKHVDNEIYALMSECWRTEPERRPTFNVVVKTLKRLERNPKNHIFMNQYEKNLYENLDDL